jgi:hypothetical protein
MTGSLVENRGRLGVRGPDEFGQCKNKGDSREDRRKGTFHVLDSKRDSFRELCRREATHQTLITV